MANILKVTTPPSQSYDNSPKGNPTNIGNTNIKNIVDPSKVTRGDSRNDFQDSGNPTLAPHYESNFGKFIQLIKNTPDIMDLLPQMFLGRMETLITSGIDQGFASEIAQYMDMMKMNEGEFSAFFKSQLDNSVGFKNLFFSVLRDFIDSDASSEFKNNILGFLKKYNDLTSNERVLVSISQNLKNIIAYIPKSEGAEIEELLKSLNLNAKAGDTNANAALLKEEIIPKIARYISRYHDFGPVRNFVTALTLDVARYENGNKDEALQAFKILSSFNSFKSRLGNMNDETLNSIFEKLLVDKATTKSPLADSLVNIIKKGLEGQAGYENKLIFQNVVQSILINSSVYMPLLHIMLPVEMAGRFMFSEVWIDPNDKSKSNSEEKRSIKLLLKFDIENIGFFDMIVYLQGKELDLQLYYPEKLEGAQKEIQKKLSGIIQNNGLGFKSLHMAKSQKRLSISEVFPQILERRNNINVTV